MPHVYLGRWEAVSDPLDLGAYWRAPGGDAIGAFDFRSLPECALVPGVDTPEGFGLFVYDGPRSYPELNRLIATEFDGQLRASELSTVNTMLGVTLGETRFDQVYRELLIAHADPTGLNKWKPKRMSRRLGWKLAIAGTQLFRERFREAHPAFQATIDVYRGDYRRKRGLGEPLEHLQKFTGAEMRKLYGRTGDDLRGLLPSEFESDGWREPATTVTEAFAGSSLGNFTQIDPATGGFTEGSGVLSRGTTAYVVFPTSMRHDTVLTSDEHFVEIIQVTDPSTSAAFITPATRYVSGGAKTFMLCIARDSGNDSDIHKVVDGTDTALATGTHTHSYPQTVRFTSDSNDDHTISYDLTDDTTVNDTSITGNTLHGVSAHNEQHNHGTADDYKAEDLAVGIGADEMMAARHLGATQPVQIPTAVVAV